MAGSIEQLIEESKQRQRLENELEIARQVQEQLFPRSLPELKTLELRGPLPGGAQRSAATTMTTA